MDVLFDYFLTDFLEYTQVTNFTTKVEMRLKNKDARIFGPANLVMVIVGNWLFGAQNEGITLFHDQIPIKIGLSNPGSEAALFWQKFILARGKALEADGQSNDASFSSICAMWCRDLRKMLIPPELRKIVDRYYNMTYCMLANYGGFLIPQIGQQTGQTNTASDNSIATLSMMIHHSFRLTGTVIPYYQISLNVVGDDVLLKDRTGIYNALDLDDTWHEHQMWLESPGYAIDSMSVTFIGMSPKVRIVDEVAYLLYIYRTDKMLDSLNYRKKSSSLKDQVFRRVNLVSNMFADETKYEIARQAVLKWASAFMDQLDIDSLRMLGSLNDIYQLKKYTGVETPLCGF
jgi:hypothetical protein